MGLRELINYDPLTGLITAKDGTPNTGVHPGGYIVVRGLGRDAPLAHRVAWEYMTGEVPETVDHINRDRTDNRWCNLRHATYGQNNLNTSVRSDSLTGIKGVSKHRRSGLWRVRYVVNDKRRTKYFHDIELAVLYASEARRKYHGEYACD